MSRTTSKNRGKYTPIGIDVRESSVHAVQFMTKNGYLDLYGATMEPFAVGEPRGDDDGALVSALNGLSARDLFVGRTVVGSMPSSHVDVRPVRLPEGVHPDSGDEFYSAMQMEARSCLLYSPDEAILDYIPLAVHNGENAPQHSVLMIAVKKDDVRRHLGWFKAAGLDCVHLDIVPCALTRILGDTEGTYAVIDLDRQQTVILFANGAELRFSRTIKLGLEVLVSDLSRTLDIGFAEAERMLLSWGIKHDQAVRYDLDRIAQDGALHEDAMSAFIFESCCRALERLAEEVQRSIDYFTFQRREGQVGRLKLVGAFVPAGLSAFLSDRLAIPTTLAEVFSRYPSGRADAAGDHQYAVAAGLALRGESG